MAREIVDEHVERASEICAQVTGRLLLAKIPDPTPRMFVLATWWLNQRRIRNGVPPFDKGLVATAFHYLVPAYNR